MNTSSEPASMLDRSTIVRAGRWLGHWRNLRKLLVVLASLITLIALAYSVETWTSKRAWEKFKAAAEARGERLDRAAFVPKPVPDDQNFAMTPFFAPLFDFQPGTQHWRDTNAAEHTRDFAKALHALPNWAGNWALAQPTRLAAWLETADKPPGKFVRPAPDTPIDPEAEKVAATAILKACQPYAPVLEEIRVASRRPYARFNIRYANEDPAAVLVPHLPVVRNLSQILALRAQAELTLGQTDTALNDVLLTLDLADAIKSEPILISHLVRFACVQITLPVVWQGLADRQWSEPQLEALETRFQKFDLVADMDFALRAEQTFGNAMIELIRNKPTMLPRIGAPDSPRPTGLGRLFLAAIPRGWFYQEELNYDQAYEQTVLAGYDLRARQFYPEQDEEHEQSFMESLRDRRALLWQHRVMTGMLLPALTKVHLKAAYAQTAVDEAVIACALERYRLATGQFPDALAALVPKFIAKLPHDLIGGGPLHYSRARDGQFLLYSIGWNHRDDGGQVVRVRGTRPSLDQTEGDWVWRYPSKS